MHRAQLSVEVGQPLLKLNSNITSDHHCSLTENAQKNLFYQIAWTSLVSHILKWIRK